MGPIPTSSRLRTRSVAALACGLAVAAALVLDAQGDRRLGSRTTVAGLMSALERTAARGDSPRLTRARLFYAKIAYRDLSVRVDGRRGPWAAYYRQVVQRWIAPDGSARLLFDIGGEALVGPRDLARWRADGAPPLGEGAGKRWEIDFRAGGFVGGNLRTKHLTYRDLLALPTKEPALDHRLDELIPPAEHAQREGAKVEAIAELIAANPTPTATRVALFEVLAGLSGLELEGARTDPYGRPGIALAVADDVGKTIVVVDPASARVLGVEIVTRRRLPYADVRPGSVTSERWFLAARIVSAFPGHLTPRPCSTSESAGGCWVWTR
jgi:hypothetical protein